MPELYFYCKLLASGLSALNAGRFVQFLEGFAAAELCWDFWECMVYCWQFPA